VRGKKEEVLTIRRWMQIIPSKVSSGSSAVSQNLAKSFSDEKKKENG